MNYSFVARKDFCESIGFSLMISSCNFEYRIQIQKCILVLNFARYKIHGFTKLRLAINLCYAVTIIYVHVTCIDHGLCRRCAILSSLSLDQARPLSPLLSL